MDYAKKSLEEHARLQGKIEIHSKSPLEDKEALSLFYTPGVASSCLEIAQDKAKSFDLTWRANTIAIVSDGTAVLGLGNLGPEGALPVMEGKSAIFREFAGVSAIPLCINTTDTEEIIKFCHQIAPSFGGINLEDISAPRCFEIEARLTAELDIPVFHDDQHGTAIVTWAGLQNALKVAEKKIADCKIVISGAGAAGIATAKLLVNAGAQHIVMCDSRGAIFAGREGLNPAKEEMAHLNLNNAQGSLKEVIQAADVFIGLSAPNLLQAEDIAQMNQNAIVFAMANPTPEIMPEEAKKGGALVVATGRSDFPNQVNNALVFPGLFKGVLEMRAKKFTPEMFLRAAEALANMVENPTPEQILPPLFDKRIGQCVATSC